jgi:hypothetical protein
MATLVVIWLKRLVLIPDFYSMGLKQTRLILSFLGVMYPHQYNVFAR